MSSSVHQVTTGITDECIRCGHICEFAPRGHVYAWRHLSSHACSCDDASPEHLSMRVITDSFLEQVRKDEESA